MITTKQIQERHDEGILDAIDYPIPHKGVTAHTDRGILLKRLEAAENAAKDYSQIAANYCVRTEAAEQKLKDIAELSTYCISNDSCLYKKHPQGAFVKHTELQAILEAKP